MQVKEKDQEYRLNELKIKELKRQLPSKALKPMERKGLFNASPQPGPRGVSHHMVTPPLVQAELKSIHSNNSYSAK
jgi:hypothetical protein